MKRNWNKFVKNLRKLGPNNRYDVNDVNDANDTNDSNDYNDIIEEESGLSDIEFDDWPETPFTQQLQKMLDNDVHRKDLLAFCKQSSVLTFEEVFPNDLYSGVERFDYGSYAELFKGIELETGREVVLKLIRAVSSDMKTQIRGTDLSSKCGTFEEIYNEFQISRVLSDLRSNQRYETQCFPEVRQMFVISGEIPTQLTDSEKPSSQLPPIKDDVFEDWVYLPREYAVLVMSYGGRPLWKAIKDRTINCKQLVSVVQQLTLGLAIAESAAEFEHRDLHISNVLINETANHKIHFIHNYNRYSVDSEGIEATIIDTTFSRLRIKNRILSKNLTNIMKFDESSALSSQDKCYKSMVQLTNNDWNKFTPKSNINWLKYICKILLASDIMTESYDQNSKNSLKRLIQLFKNIDSLKQLDFTII